MLFVAALYQTGTLWLENYSGHNFFYYISSFHLASSEKNVVSEPLDAKYITVGYGNKSFDVLYGQNKNELQTGADALIKQAVESGSSLVEENTDFTQIIDKRAVIYVMPCESNVNEYASSVSKKADKRENYVHNFTSIVVVPSSGMNDESSVYFINEKENSAVCYKGAFVSGQKLYALIDKQAEKQADNISYISTAQNGFNIFGENIFVPHWMQNRAEYNTAEEKSIFDVNNDNEMLTKIEPFFGSYHGQTWDKDEKGGFTISDNDIVVKYSDENNILEYYSYKAEGNEQSQSMYSAYSACKSFLKNDETLKTDIYLSDIQVKNNTIIFYYDYCIDNMPVFVQTEEENNHALEITVKNNSVKNYRRYAVDFEKTNETEYAEKDFLGAINEAASLIQDGETLTDIENMVLGYGKDENGKYSLKWFTYISGKQYVTDTKNS